MHVQCSPATEARNVCHMKPNSLFVHRSVTNTVYSAGNGNCSSCMESAQNARARHVRYTPQTTGTAGNNRKGPETVSSTFCVFCLCSRSVCVCVCVCVCVWRPFLVLLSLRDQSIFIFYFLSAGRITQLYNIGFSTFGESGVVIRIEFVYRLPADIKERLAESASRK